MSVSEQDPVVTLMIALSRAFRVSCLGPPSWLRLSASPVAPNMNHDVIDNSTNKLTEYTSLGWSFFLDCFGGSRGTTKSGITGCSGFETTVVGYCALLWKESHESY